MEFNLTTLIELGAVIMIPIIGVIVGYAKLQSKVDRVDRDVAETVRRFEQHEAGRHERNKNIWDRINEVDNHVEEGLAMLDTNFDTHLAAMRSNMDAQVAALRAEMDAGFQRLIDGQAQILSRVSRLEGIEEERRRRGEKS